MTLHRSSRNGTSPEETRDSGLGRTGFSGCPFGTDRPARRRPARAGPLSTVPITPAPCWTDPACWRSSSTAGLGQTQVVFKFAFDREPVVHARPINRARHWHAGASESYSLFQTARGLARAFLPAPRLHPRRSTIPRGHTWVSPPSRRPLPVQSCTALPRYGRRWKISLYFLAGAGTYPHGL